MTIEDYKNVLVLINRVANITGAEAMGVAVLIQKIQAEMKALTDKPVVPVADEA